ncbi:DUF2023 family protein [Thermodesulfovibrionales bacterium]|nr:DUF2023 family protein [Thermodesulfovibrionales bacterium]
MLSIGHAMVKQKMRVFRHHIYEYKKGLRNLILHTTNKSFRDDIEERLKKDDISYLIYSAGYNNINVFFGNDICIDIIKSINKQCLTEYSDEEDFILGIMLGYDRLKQCERYFKRKQKLLKVTNLAG